MVVAEVLCPLGPWLELSEKTCWRCIDKILCRFREVIDCLLVDFWIGRNALSSMIYSEEGGASGMEFYRLAALFCVVAEGRDAF